MQTFALYFSFAEDVGSCCETRQQLENVIRNSLSTIKYYKRSSSLKRIWINLGNKN